MECAGLMLSASRLEEARVSAAKAKGPRRQTSITEEKQMHGLEGEGPAVGTPQSA